MRNWGIRLTSVGVLGAMMLNVAVPESSAAPANPGSKIAAVAPAAKSGVAPTPAATLKKRRTKPAETYNERQERIGKSKRSMLAPLAENKGQDTSCVSAEFTTLSVVYDSIIESLLPSLPPQLQAAAKANQRDVQAWMKNVHVSTLAVSDNPNTRGTDADDPQYRTALSQIVVNNLLKIRDGKQNEAIPVSNITLSQAVESVWLYVFAGVLAPVGFALAMSPGVSAGGVPLNMLLNLGFTGSRLGLMYLYQGTASSILNQCVAQVTDEQKELAGKPSDTVRYDIPIHPLLQGAANQLALADKDTCTPIGDLSLGRIVKRTAEHAKETAPDAATRRQIDGATKQLLAQMKATRVPHNLIPADPADFNNIESVISMAGPVALNVIPMLGGVIGDAVGTDLDFLNYLAYVGGAPLDIMIGLSHNINQGDNLAEMVSVHDLTVTKSLTAAYYAYYTSLWLFSTIGSITEAGNIVYTADPLKITVSPTKMIAAVLGLPLTYGLVTFHNVVRSTCFVEDDLTGTGLGAEANKLAPEAHAKAVATKRAKEKEAAAKAAKSAKSKATSTTKKKAPAKSTTKKTAPATRTGTAKRTPSSTTSR